VQAPGGQVVFNHPQGILQQFADSIFPSAYALVTGLSPVPDGTSVQLIRLNATGTSFTVLTSTMTSGGRYSFNLTSLGLQPSSDLAVRVANGAVQMRAFVTGSNVDMDPVSEAAVQLVLEQILATPGATISHYSVQELADLSESIKTLSSVKQLTAGLNVADTITSIRNTVAAEPGLMAFMTAASGDGQTTEGPGDVGKYFPFEQGNTWRYEGTVSLTGTPTVNYSDSTSITGTKVIGGVTTTVILEENHNNEGTPEEDYEVKDSRSTILYGNNDSSDFITPQLVPLRGVHFPLVEGVVVELVNKNGLNSGLDLDGDGKQEKVNIQLEYTVLGFETVMVSAGTFFNAAKVEIRQTDTYFSSAFGGSATIKQTLTEWRAPGVGFVKKIEVNKSEGFSDDFTQTVTEELVDVFIAKQVSLATNDIIYDPNSKMIYASTPGTPGTITPIDPTNGTIGTPIPVGNEPKKLARSDDGQYLYVGLDGEGAVQRVDLATQALGPKFVLGSDSFFGPYYVEDMEVLPGSPQSIAVSRQYKGVSPRHAGVAIYDNEVQRPNATPGHTGSNVIEFSQSASRLYGYDNESTEFGFRRMAVDSSGVSILDMTPNLINAFSADIRFDAGRIYSTRFDTTNGLIGTAIDPVSLSSVGTYSGLQSLPSMLPLVEPDSSTGRVFFLVKDFNEPRPKLLAFSQLGFQLLGAFDLVDVMGTPSRLIRWGAKGLAFRTDAGQVFLIQSDKLIP
jgi:hypothetical protein